MKRVMFLLIFTFLTFVSIFTTSGFSFQRDAGNVSLIIGLQTNFYNFFSRHLKKIITKIDIL